jgi:hypothetical protein
MQMRNPAAHAELERLAVAVFANGEQIHFAEKGEAFPAASSIGAARINADGVAFENVTLRNEYLSRYAAHLVSTVWTDRDAVTAALDEIGQHTETLGSRRDVHALVWQILAGPEGRDVLGFVASLAEDAAAGRHGFWSVYGAFCDALPVLDLDEGALAETLSAIFEATENDLAGGVIYDAVLKRASISRERAEAMVAAFSERTDRPTITFVPTALLGLSKFDLSTAHATAMGWTAVDQPVIRRAGIAALGAFQYGSDRGAELLRSTCERFQDMRQTADVEIDYTLIRAHANLREQAPSLRAGLEELAGRHDPSSRHEMARALSTWAAKEAQEEWWVDVLMKLAGTPTDEQRTFGFLDHAVAKAHPEIAVRFIERVVAELTPQTEQLKIEELLPSTARMLHDGGKKELEAAITKWFVSREERLHSAAHEFVHTHGTSRYSESTGDLALDGDVLARTNGDDTIAALQRIMGWIIYGRPLASLLVSAIGRNVDRSGFVDEFVAGALSDWVLYNYPGSAGDYLRDILGQNDGERTTEVIRQALDSSEAYYKALQNRPDLLDLHITTRRLHLINLANTRIQARIMNDARRRSTLLSLVNRVPLKYGRAWLDERVGDLSEPSKLATFSHEVELPRGEIIDPVGHGIRRLRLRRTCLTDPSDHTESGDA